MAIKFMKNNAKELKPNIFMQETEPETKEGIWIQSNKNYEKINITTSIVSNPEFILKEFPEYSASPNKLRTIVIDKNIYCVYGDGTMLKLDTLKKTWTKLIDSGLDLPAGGPHLGYKNGIIYILNNWNTSSTKVYEYEITSNTIINSYDISGLPNSYLGADIQIDDKIYLFTSNSNTFYIYNISTKEFSTENPLSFTTVNEGNEGAWICTNGINKIYIFSNNSEIYEYDIDNKSSTLILDLKQITSNNKTIKMNYFNGFLFIVQTDGNGYLTIYKFSLANNSGNFLEVPEDSNYMSSIESMPIVNNKIILLSSINFRNWSILLPYNVFENKTIIISKGDTYYTEIVSNDNINGRITFDFDNVYYNTTEDGLDDTLPTYYGTGTEWVKFKN